jgi:mono/diheme cytochrome c family protein
VPADRLFVHPAIEELMRCLALIGLLLACPTLAPAQAIRPGRLSPEERESLRPGVLVKFMVDGTVLDCRDLRMPAIVNEPKQSPSPFVPMAVHERITGYLKLPLRGEYEFSFAGVGSIKLLVNGQQVAQMPNGNFENLPPVKVNLVKGYNRVEIDYHSSQEVHQLRMAWASDEFPAEPVPPNLWWFDSRDAEWQQGMALRHGRQLFAERRCTQCHEISQVAVDHIKSSPRPMPELASDAPSLIAAGQRFEASWLRQWTVDPASLRNRTTMPRVLAHLDAKTQTQQAADIAAFLGEQRDEEFKPLAPDAGDGRASDSDELCKQGEELFEDRGCIACHRFTPPSESDEFHRVSLHFAGQKYQPGALAAFLKDSQHYYAWSRMPKFAVTDGEATALAAFIRRGSQGQLPPVAAAAAPNAERGRKLFAEVGCANCHALGQGDRVIPPRGRIALVDRNAGCLGADEDAKTSPRFVFDEAQRTALAAFLKTDLTSLACETPAEFSRRQVEAIGCKACHSRDGVDADLPYILAEFGQLGHPPEPIPELTWAGEKLRPAWTEQQFLGELKYRPRPHFHTQMPAFPTRAKLLAAGLSHEHGYAVDEDPRPKFDAKRAETGEAVAAMNTGLACHRCHAIGDKEAEAPFEARSTNLSVASERLRYPFFHRWMRDPLRIDPQTKMIKFAQDGKKTGLTTIYDGDGHQQFEAVWHYLQTLSSQRPTK